MLARLRLMPLILPLISREPTSCAALSTSSDLGTSRVSEALLNCFAFLLIRVSINKGALQE
jgi:hypothetical protein